MAAAATTSIIIVTLLCLAMPVAALVGSGERSGTDGHPAAGVEPSGRVAGKTAARSYNFHSAITIDGDSNFTAKNGVTGGSGSSADPFIIEGWEITANDDDGITISRTSAFYIIRNLWIHGAWGRCNGIVLINSDNGMVRDCVIQNNHGNIEIYGCVGLRIIDNEMLSQSGSNCYSGIWIYDKRPRSSGDITISGNLVGGCNKGIIANGYEISVTGNEVYDTGWGISVSGSDCLVIGNNVSSSGCGIELTSLKNSVASNNIVINAVYGISAPGAVLVTIKETTIRGCSEGGVFVYQSDGLNLSRCSLTGITGTGIEVNDSKSVAIDNCTLTGCGLDVVESFHLISVDNTTVDGKPVRYINKARDIAVPAGAGQVFLFQCSNISVSGSFTLNVPAPVNIFFSNDIRVEYCNISKAITGVFISNSKNITINRSRIQNTQTCIKADYSRLTVGNSSLASRNPGLDLHLRSGSVADVVNCTLNQSRVFVSSEYSICRVSWLVSVALVDAESGRGVKGGNVTVVNHTRATIFNGTTGPDGCIRDIVLLESTHLNKSRLVTNKYNIIAKAEFYVPGRSEHNILVGQSFSYNILMWEQTAPWSHIGELPTFWNDSRGIPLCFAAGDNGSGLEYVEIYSDASGRWELFQNATGVSRFTESPVLFDNLTAEKDYAFYCVASDGSTHRQGPPYDIALTRLDITAPDCAFTPADGTAAAPAGTSVTVTFSETVDLQSVKAEVTPGKWTARWSQDGLSLTFNPVGALEYGTAYKVRVLSATDLAGNRMAPREAGFRTVNWTEPDITQPSVVGIAPRDGSDLPAGPSTVTLEFSEPMNWTAVAGALRVNGWPAPAGRGNGSRYSFTLDSGFGDTFAVVLETTASDIAGNGLQSRFTAVYTCPVPGVPLGSISGRVVSDLGGNLSGVHITIGHRRLVTDLNGLFNASRLAAGTYLVTASGLAGYFPDDKAFDLGPGENLTVTIVLWAMNGSLSGLVRIGDGRPIAGASVTILSGGERVAGVLTNRSGYFKVFLRPGTYAIRVSAGGFYDEALDDREVLPGQAVGTELIVMAYVANEPGSSLIPVTVICILLAATLGLLHRGTRRGG